MTEPTKVALNYFEASNRSSFGAIEKMMSPLITYVSDTMGMYLGRDEVLSMQKSFHASFDQLNWRVDSLREDKPGIISVDYTFTATSGDKTTQSWGIEYILIAEGLNADSLNTWYLPQQIFVFLIHAFCSIYVLSGN